MIFAIRADYQGPCATYPELASRVGEGAVLVGPMSDAEVRRAVEGPASYAGLDVEQDLLDARAADVRSRQGAGRGVGGGRSVEGRVPGRVTGRVSRLPA